MHSGAKLPGSEYWHADDEWPAGDFGFVWGCYWGDDSSWKVQYLDLSRIEEGMISRDERFGYVELATIGYQSPCQRPELEPLERSAPPSFIRVSRFKGLSKVTFAVETAFDLSSGKPEEWQRVRIKNLE